jgi:hypothetical protein
MWRMVFLEEQKKGLSKRLNQYSTYPTFRNMICDFQNTIVWKKWYYFYIKHILKQNIDTFSKFIFHLINLFCNTRTCIESCLLAVEIQIKLVFTYVSNNCYQIFEHTTFFETNTYSTCWFVCCHFFCLKLLFGIFKLVISHLRLYIQKCTVMSVTRQYKLLLYILHRLV